MSKILIVEDDKYLINAYRVKMAKEGFEVQLAMDGDEALLVLNSFHPDVILLDLVMPKRDGFSVLEEIKKNPKLNKIPVIIASNLGQKEDIDRGMKLGATDYIIKSDMSMEGIVGKIQKIIS
jgi:DNA-binding response OmpR family regulator